VVRAFAVVAQDVSEFQQRSAQAAKEIKDLIRTSALEVQCGVELVNETGVALRCVALRCVALKTIQEFVGTVNHQYGCDLVAGAVSQSVWLR
jgi:methyl-accepting chemotaxis protein